MKTQFYKKCPGIAPDGADGVVAVGILGHSLLNGMIWLSPIIVFTTIEHRPPFRLTVPFWVRAYTLISRNSTISAPTSFVTHFVYQDYLGYCSTWIGPVGRNVLVP